MPDELVKMFLEEVIDSISNLSDALSCILQYYCVAVEENKFELLGTLHFIRRKKIFINCYH